MDFKQQRVQAVQALGIDLLDVLAGIRDQILILDREQRTVAIWGEWPGNCVWRSADLIGRTFREVFGPQWAGIHEAANARALQGECVASEWTVSKAQQTARFSTAVSPLRDQSSNIVGLVIVTRNITSLTREEKRLNASIAQKTKQLIDLEQGVRRLADVIKHHRTGDAPGNAAAEPGADSSLSQLSPRERQVLDLLGQGYRPRSIAAVLGVRLETVRNHLKTMFKKTGTHSQEELTARFRDTGDDV